MLVVRCHVIWICVHWPTHLLPKQAISACGLEAGDLVALSLEGRHPQAARAWVHGVQASSITLALDRPLRPGLVQQGQVCFVGGGFLARTPGGISQAWNSGMTTKRSRLSQRARHRYLIRCAFARQHMGARTCPENTIMYPQNACTSTTGHS